MIRKCDSTGKPSSSSSSSFLLEGRTGPREATEGNWMEAPAGTTLLPDTEAPRQGPAWAARHESPQTGVGSHGGALDPWNPCKQHQARIK